MGGHSAMLVDDDGLPETERVLVTQVFDAFGVAVTGTACQGGDPMFVAPRRALARLTDRAGASASGQVAGRVTFGEVGLPPGSVAFDTPPAADGATGSPRLLIEVGPQGPEDLIERIGLALLDLVAALVLVFD